MKLKTELNKEELAIFRKLNTPRKIQDFLEELRINFDKGNDTCMSPRRVLRERKAHCVEGAMLAAAVLWFNGEKPLLLDLSAVDRDFDHVVTLFRRNGFLGAISKTNHAVLRYREPVYRTVRELALSYFHEYFDDVGRKNLREYSTPLDLRKFDVEWVVAEEDPWYIAEALCDIPHKKIVDRKTIASFRRADPVEIEAGKLVQYKNIS